MRLSAASDLADELRVVVRGLRRRPLFSLAVVATLALAIGANTAIFTVVNAVLVQKLPYEDPERLTAVVRAGAMRLFERDDALLGFGIIRPVIAGRPEVDLGLAVDARFRNKGYAVYFLRDMAEFCLQSGLIPISGCAAENEASIRLGSRVGFVSRYRLLEVGFESALGS